MSPDSTSSQPVWMGIDIAKDQIDFFVFNRKENPSGRSPRRAAALTKQAKQWRQLGVSHALLEASGGYEREVWAALEAASIQVTVVSPSRVRKFADACGIAAKTDRIDASVAARYGEAVQPDPTPLPSPRMSRYRELLRHLNYVVDERAKFRTRRHRVGDSAVRRSIERIIDSLSAEVERLEHAVEQALEAMPQAAALAKQLKQAAGVGQKTAWALTAELTELGTLTGKQAAALAGLAPRARDSGSRSGRRSIGGGRQRLRKALYMAARTAVRVDRRLKLFYERLQAAGKVKQLGLIAVARRLLVMLNAMVRDGVAWIPAPVA